MHSLLRPRSPKGARQSQQSVNTENGVGRYRFWWSALKILIGASLLWRSGQKKDWSSSSVTPRLLTFLGGTMTEFPTEAMRSWLGEGLHFDEIGAQYFWDSARVDWLPSKRRRQPNSLRCVWRPGCCWEGKRKWAAYHLHKSGRKNHVIVMAITFYTVWHFLCSILSFPSLHWRC